MFEEIKDFLENEVEIKEDERLIDVMDYEAEKSALELFISPSYCDDDYCEVSLCINKEEVYFKTFLFSTVWGEVKDDILNKAEYDLLDM